MRQVRFDFLPDFHYVFFILLKASYLFIIPFLSLTVIHPLRSAASSSPNSLVIVELLDAIREFLQNGVYHLTRRPWFNKSALEILKFICSSLNPYPTIVSSSRPCNSSSKILSFSSPAFILTSAVFVSSRQHRVRNYI